VVRIVFVFIMFPFLMRWKQSAFYHILRPAQGVNLSRAVIPEQ
jgi:hypothetical protein